MEVGLGSSYKGFYKQVSKTGISVQDSVLFPVILR